MKLMLLPNTKLIFLLFLCNIFHQSNAYHLKNKNGTEFRTLMSLFTDEKFVDINREKFNTFLKSINFQRFDDDYSKHICKETDCVGENTKCVEAGDGYICECIDGFVPKDGTKKGRKDARCIVPDYVCKDSDCLKPSTKCVAKGTDFFCECEAGYKLKEGETAYKNKKECDLIAVPYYVCKDSDCPKPSTKCIAKGTDFVCECEAGYKLKEGETAYKNKKECDPMHICKETDCVGENTKCVEAGDGYICECKDGFVPKDDTQKGRKDARCIDKYKCENTDCFGENQKCVPNGNDYYCDCNEGFELKDKSKKGTKYIKCKIIAVPDYVCKDADCPGVS